MLSVDGNKDTFIIYETVPGNVAEIDINSNIDKFEQRF